MNAARSTSGHRAVRARLEERVLVGTEPRERVLVGERLMVVVMVLVVSVAVVVLVVLMPAVAMLVFVGHARASVASSCAPGAPLSTLVASPPHDGG